MPDTRTAAPLSSSLDDPERGLSFQQPGPLDMRFNRDEGEPASSLLKRLSERDLADLFWWLANLPPHLNINAIELMPVSQSWAGFSITREA